MNEYKNFIRKKIIIILVLLALLILSISISSTIGSSDVKLSDVIRVFMNRSTSKNSSIILNIRLPRIITGALVGAALSLSGVIMQNLLRNPLASSSTLGVTQGASFGAAFSIVFYDSIINIIKPIPLLNTIINITSYFAFFGGMLSTLIIMLLSKRERNSTISIILAGTALSSLFIGGSTILQYFADDIAISSIVYWTFGDLGRTSWNNILFLSIVTFVIFIIFFLNRWSYNSLEAGLEAAKSLGVPVNILIYSSITLSTLLTSISVSLVGSIGFIGLIAPHISRKIIGNDYRFLLPASMLMGGILLVLAEIVSRTVASPSILPIGALTSFLGAPVFIYMIYRGDYKL